MSRSRWHKTEWVNNDFGHIYLGQRLYAGRSKFQSLELVKNKTFGTLLFLDSKIQISERDEDRYHQYLIAAPLLAHPRPRTLCIVGGGDGFGLEEAVKHRSLERILMLEIDPGVLKFCSQHYPVIQKILKDKRIVIHFTDARQWLEKNQEKFDVIAIDLTEPHGPSKMLYTREFYCLCQQRLTSTGILSLHTDNYSLFPEAYATIYKTLSSVFFHILTARVDMPSFGMGWTYRLASTRPISYRRLFKNTKVLARQEGSLDQFTPSAYLVDPTPEELKIIKSSGYISTDAKPFDKFESLDKKVTGSSKRVYLKA